MCGCAVRKREVEIGWDRMYRKRKTYILTITYVQVRTYRENEITTREGGEKCLENSQMQTQTQMQMPEPVAELVSGALHGSFHRQFAQDSHKCPNVNISASLRVWSLSRPLTWKARPGAKRLQVLSTTYSSHSGGEKRTIGIGVFMLTF